MLDPAPCEILLGLCFLLYCCSRGSSEVHCSGSYSFRLVLLFLEDWCCCWMQIPLCPACLCNLAAQVLLCLLAPGNQLSVPTRPMLPCLPWLTAFKKECCTHQQVLAASAINVASPQQLLPRTWHSFHDTPCHHDIF